MKKRFLEQTKQYTVLDILPHVSWKNVKRAIKYFYPSDKNDYSKLFEHLKTVKSEKHKNKKEFITIGAINFWPEGNGKFRIEEEDSRGYSIATNLYSMSFRKWSELLNIPIEPETLDKFLLEDIVAHFIWEITYYGLEEDSTKKGQELIKRVEEIRKEIEP